MFVGSLVIGGMSVLWSLTRSNSPKSALPSSSNSRSKVCVVVDKGTNRVTPAEGPVAVGVSARKVGCRGTSVSDASDVGTALPDSSPRDRLCDPLNF